MHDWYDWNADCRRIYDEATEKGNQLSGGSPGERIDLKHAHLNISPARSCHPSVEMSRLQLRGKLIVVRRSNVQL